MTDAERRLWLLLRNRRLQGFKFRRQMPIGLYLADFVCLKSRLIVELDGGQHAEQATKDGMRDAWLEAQDFRVLNPPLTPAPLPQGERRVWGLKP